MNNDEIVKMIETAEAEGANVYVDKNTGIATSEFYRTEISKLDFKIDTDFHKLETKARNEEKGKWEVDESKTVYAPKVYVLDRIADCAGIVFIKNETNEIFHNDEYGKHTAFVSTCMGRKLMSDGNNKDSSLQIYEFDPLIQAMSENTEEAKMRKKSLEYRKNAAKRAETGARLRVIRELVGLPQGFPKERAEKYFIIGRIVPNLKQIASTERGRALAECKALGIDPALLLYGARKNQELLPAQDTGEYPDKPKPVIAPATPPAGAGVPPAANIMEAAATSEPAAGQREVSRFDSLTNAIVEFAEGYEPELNVTNSQGQNPYQLALAELKDKNATEKTRAEMLDRLRKFLKLQGVNV